MRMIDFDQRQDQTQRIGRLRLAASFRSSSGRGHHHGGGDHRVVVRGSYRYHKGQKSKSDPSGRMKAHLKYAAGERADQIAKGTDQQRQLFDSRGRPQTATQAMGRHEEAGIFLEHRIVLSPSGQASEGDLHVLAQATIKEIQSRNPGAEIEASYAIHTDTDHPHSHILITSPNRLELRKEDYQHLRQQAQELRQELEFERSQGRTHSHTLENALADDRDQGLGE